MGKKYLASVANVELFAKENGNLVHWASAKTLTDSAFGFTLSMEETFSTRLRTVASSIFSF